LTKDGQALTEFAIFGGILLLVLSFFLSYAVRMDSAQNLKLKVFRMALNEAYDSANLIPDRPDNAASIVIYEDKHVPDPRNIAARGSYSTMAAGAAVVWGDSLGRVYDGNGNPRQPYSQDEDFAHQKFIINGQQRSYGTEYRATIWSDIHPEGVWVNLQGVWGNLNGETRLISWANLHCYQPDPTMEKRVNAYLGGTESILVSEVGVDVDSDGNLQPEEWMQITGILGSPKDGDPITGLITKTATFGEMNPYHLSIDYIKQYANNDLSTLEGVILAEDSKVNRQQITGTFIETTNVYTSQTQYDLSGTQTTHTLKTQGLPETFVFEPAQKHGAFAWRTQPKAK